MHVPYQHACADTPGTLSLAQPARLLQAPLAMIASHPEHESIYANDIACRPFGRETLRSVCNLMLDNLPTGASSSGLARNATRMLSACLLVRRRSACAASC